MFESRSTVADQSVNELSEVSVTDDSYNFLSSSAHFFEQFLECCNEVSLRRLKCHSSVGVKLDCSLNANLRLFFLILAHLSQDQVGTFLVDFHLSLNDHVIDQSDESSQTVVVPLGKLEYSVFEFSLLLQKHH